MAARLRDGFEQYANSTQASRLYDEANFTVVTGLLGYGQAIQHNGTPGVKKTFDNQQIWIVGIRYKPTSIVGNIWLIDWLDSGSNQIRFQQDVAGRLQLLRGASTVLATAPWVMSPGGVYHIAVKLTIDNSIGAVTVKINGVQDNDLTISSVDTQATGNAYANQIQLLSHISQQLDDLYINDGSGASHNDFEGTAPRIVTDVPSGAGNYAQFTPSAGANYQNVDDPTPDDDATYNESSTPGHIDTFAYPALPSGTIYDVSVLTCARKTDAGSRTLREKARISGADYDGTVHALADSFGLPQHIFGVNPATAAAWVPSDVAEFGYELVT